VADGHFTLRIPEMSDTVWQKLTTLMDRDDLREDPRFAGAAERRRHRSEIESLLRQWARHKTRQELWDGLRPLDYFGAPVLSTAEVLEDPHIKVRQAYIKRRHPTAGPATLLAPWIHMSKTPTEIRADAPTLGQHTDEVLGGLLNLTAAELSDLRAQGVIK